MFSRSYGYPAPYPWRYGRGLEPDVARRINVVGHGLLLASQYCAAADLIGVAHGTLRVKRLPVQWSAQRSREMEVLEVVGACHYLLFVTF